MQWSAPSTGPGRAPSLARPGPSSNPARSLPTCESRHPRRRLPVAHKRFPAVPVKAGRAPRTARPAPVRMPTRARACLVHGFLVRLARPSTGAAGSATPAGSAVAVACARARRPADAKREGPSDDATFH